MVGGDGGGAAGKGGRRGELDTAGAPAGLPHHWGVPAQVGGNTGTRHGYVRQCPVNS